MKRYVFYYRCFTALHRCVREDNTQACHILLTYNVDTSIVSIQGYTAMKLASDNIKAILQGRRFSV